MDSTSATEGTGVVEAELVDDTETSPPGNYPVVTKRHRTSRDYSPKVEKDEHKKYYQYYESIGKERTLAKVATHFGKSVKLMSILSAKFDWTGRVRRYETLISDPVAVGTKPVVDKTRERLIFIIEEITETMHEIAVMSRRVRLGLAAAEAEEAKAKLERLQAALSLFGFKWSNTRDFRDLVSSMKDIVRFNESDVKPSVPPPGNGGPGNIRINKVQLLIKE